MLVTFLTAFALVLVFEGIIPFLSPNLWRRMMLKIVMRNSKSIRIMGFVSMILGALLMYLIHSGILFSS